MIKRTQSMPLTVEVGQRWSYRITGGSVWVVTSSTRNWTKLRHEQSEGAINLTVSTDELTDEQGWERC